jgi:hypothetical protein
MGAQIAQSVLCFIKKGGKDSAMVVMASARVEEWVQLNIKVGLEREN